MRDFLSMMEKFYETGKKYEEIKIYNQTAKQLGIHHTTCMYRVREHRKYLEKDPVYRAYKGGSYLKHIKESPIKTLGYSNLMGFKLLERCKKAKEIYEANKKINGLILDTIYLDYFFGLKSCNFSYMLTRLEWYE